MKHRLFSAAIALMLLLALPVQAISPRAVFVVPDISFDGTEATCSVRITADNATDKISATMELWQGNALIDEWTGTGNWNLTLVETAAVSKNKTYQLVINYSINGIEKTPATVTRTNS